MKYYSCHLLDLCYDVRVVFVAYLYMLCHCLLCLLYILDVLVSRIIIDSSTPPSSVWHSKIPTVVELLRLTGYGPRPYLLKPDSRFYLGSHRLLPFSYRPYEQLVSSDTTLALYRRNPYLRTSFRVILGLCSIGLLVSKSID